MAICNTYTFPADAYPQSTETATQCWVLPTPSQCGGVNPLYPSCDECNPLPYVPGDVLRFQWQLADRLNDWFSDPPNTPFGIRLEATQANWLVQVDVADADGNVLYQAETPTLAGWVAALDSGERLQTVFFDTTDAPACFRLKITLNKGGYSTDEYYTDLYQQAVCHDTVLVTAVTPGTTRLSCFGYYTATLESAVNSGTITVQGAYQQFLPQIRLYGDLRVENFDLTGRETTPLGATKKLTSFETWRLYWGQLTAPQTSRFVAVLAADYVDIETVQVEKRLIFSGQLAMITDSGTDFYGPIDLATPPCIEQSGCAT